MGLNGTQSKESRRRSKSLFLSSRWTDIGDLFSTYEEEAS